jgi:hypothetical protein
MEMSCRWWPIWYLLFFCHGAKGISTIISYMCNYSFLMYYFPYTQGNTSSLLCYFQLHVVYYFPDTQRKWKYLLLHDKRIVNTKWAAIDKTSPSCLSLSVSHSVFSEIINVTVKYYKANYFNVVEYILISLILFLENVHESSIFKTWIVLALHVLCC